MSKCFDNSVITYDEIIDVEAKCYEKETKTFPTIFHEKKAAYKTQNFHILLAFSLTIIALLILSVLTFAW